MLRLLRFSVAVSILTIGSAGFTQPAVAAFATVSYIIELQIQAQPGFVISPPVGLGPGGVIPSPNVFGNHTEGGSITTSQAAPPNLGFTITGNAFSQALSPPESLSEVLVVAGPASVTVTNTQNTDRVLFFGIGDVLTASLLTVCPQETAEAQALAIFSAQGDIFAGGPTFTTFGNFHETLTGGPESKFFYADGWDGRLPRHFTLWFRHSERLERFPRSPNLFKLCSGPAWPRTFIEWRRLASWLLLLEIRKVAACLIIKVGGIGRDAARRTGGEAAWCWGVWVSRSSWTISVAKGGGVARTESSTGVIAGGRRVAALSSRRAWTSVPGDACAEAGCHLAPR